MSKIKHILSVINYTICGLCVFSLPISLMMIERIYRLCHIIIIKSEVWTITHCLGLGHETMVCAVCLSIFLFVYKLFPKCPIGLIFWKEHANHTAVHGISRMWITNIWCKFDEYEVLEHISDGMQRYSTKVAKVICVLLHLRRYWITRITAYHQ